MPGRFIWYDLATSDAAKASSFYTSLFGWELKSEDMGSFGTYTLIKAGGQEIGGIYQGEMPTCWAAYITVDDVDASAAKAASLGGTVVVPPADIPNVGRFAGITDPVGSYFQLFRGNDGMEGPAEPDVPPDFTFCWSENLTTDTGGALAFYNGLFGWTSSEFDMGEMGVYHLIRNGDKDIAGMMKMPPDAQGKPAWLSYIAVPSVDESAAKVTALGGTVCVPPTDIPGAGRFSVCMDPLGAMFGLYRKG